MGCGRPETTPHLPTDCYIRSLCWGSVLSRPWVMGGSRPSAPHPNEQELLGDASLGLCAHPRPMPGTLAWSPPGVRPPWVPPWPHEPVSALGWHQPCEQNGWAQAKDNAGSAPESRPPWGPALAPTPHSSTWVGEGPGSPESEPQPMCHLPEPQFLHPWLSAVRVHLRGLWTGL